MLLNVDACWLQLLKTFLPEMSLQDLLKCNVDPDNINFDIPNFYRQVLCAWFQLKQNLKVLWKLQETLYVCILCILFPTYNMIEHTFQYNIT